MPGPAPKPPDRRQRRNKRPTLTLAPAVVGIATRVRIPPAPAGLLDSTIAEWNGFWRSQYARLLQKDRDLRALRRLFGLYDEYERAHRMYRKQRMVQGSQGQLVLNPMARMMTALAAEIRQLEGAFGFSPRAAVTLGTQIGGLQKTLEDINEAANAPNEDDGPDPRLEARR